MTNEAKTESIVRRHFEKFEMLVDIEEKISDNPRIKKLLKTASKRGEGAGFPDFIISYKKPGVDFLIVVECKGDVSMHESPKKNNFSQCAVDGALLYASHLAKDFDVLAIGVSGESKKELKISHYLHLKGENKPVSCLMKGLLAPDDYLEEYKTHPDKYKQDYKNLMKFTKDLNEKLYGLRILEGNRSTLVSSILIALQNKAFKKSYGDYDDPRSLATGLTKVTNEELLKAGIDQSRLNILKNTFAFIESDASLTFGDNLRLLISDIDNNVISFIKTHKYQDILGDMYVEFLRYANTDKELGIVLTPPHITELFSDLVQVNKDSVVYDNCAGTGGFLINAMRVMVKDAGGDRRKISEIKNKQLFGVEYQSHIYALSISNMFIHQDGKTSIFKDDCFNSEIIKSIKEKRPNIGMLNPPYKASKKKETNDKEELEFVLNNIECLQIGGKCVAIIPMQSAISTSGKILKLKERLLKKHTLEAVLSMPDELFFDSNASVVTCVMIITAHVPHPVSKETYFGYYKNDGFVKRKGKGRIDEQDVWEEIKNKWLHNFINAKNEDGFSLKKKVTADMEWSAEAYMKTDYSNIAEADFMKSVKEYVAFNLLISDMKTPLREIFPVGKVRRVMPFSESTKWSKFKISELFNITGTKTTPHNKLKEYGEGEFSYVTTQTLNNGVGGSYSHYTEEGEVLTIDSAVIGHCTYQKKNFSASDHVEKLVPKFEMNGFAALFLVTILNMERYRYNYGRKCSQERMKKAVINLPSDENGKPDFQLMEDYIKGLYNKLYRMLV